MVEGRTPRCLECPSSVGEAESVVVGGVGVGVGGHVVVRVVEESCAPRFRSNEGLDAEVVQSASLLCREKFA